MPNNKYREEALKITKIKKNDTNSFLNDNSSKLKTIKMIELELNRLQPILFNHFMNIYNILTHKNLIISLNDLEELRNNVEQKDDLFLYLSSLINLMKLHFATELKLV